VECVADDDLLDYGRHFVATDRSCGKKTLENPQLAGAKGGGTASAAVTRVRLAHGGAILQGWFSENWSVCPARVAADHK
jgi:hypothetical protein